MSISVPVERYAKSVLGQTNSSTFHPDTTVTAGSVVVLLTTSTSGKTVTGVTDSLGNTWDIPVISTANPNLACSVISAQVATQITHTDTITVTYSNGFGASVQFWLEEVTTGLAATFQFDLSVENFGSTLTSPFVTAGPTGTLSHANEIVFGIAKMALLGTTFTPDTGWTNVTTPVLQANAAVIYRIVSSTSSVTPRGTWDGPAIAQDVFEMMATTFADTPTPPPPPPVFTANPVVTGLGHVGDTETTTKGTTTNPPVVSRYQWKRDTGGGYTSISGATGNSYKLGALDAGANVKCSVTAANRGGSDSADSNVIAVPTPPAPPDTYAAAILTGAVW